MACVGPYRWTPDRREEVEAALRGSRTRAEAAEKLGTTAHGVDSACEAYGFKAGAMLGRAAPNLKHAAPEPALVIGSAPREPDMEPDIPAETGSATPGTDSLLALLFDLHLPDHDRPAWSSVLRWLQDHKPSEVILSEFAEWESASQHGGNWGTRWDRDVAAVRRGLIQIRSILPDAKIVWQETNHDTRLTRLLEDRLPAFSGALTVARELGLKDMGIEWVNERTVIRRGALKVIHGHQLATNDRSGLLPKYHAARAVQLYGEPGVTVVYGHTHRTQSWTEPCDGGEKRAVNVGCLRTLRPAWQRGREAGWLHQFAAAYVSASGPANLYLVDIHGGSFAFEGKRYAA
jgi:hypothetical protein